jgi:predicted membrane protein
MLGRLARAFSILLLGWFAFVMGAVVYAKVMGRDSTTPEPDADEIDLVTTFGPLEYANTASAFRGGKVTTWFGGGQLDLRGATLDPAGATIRTNTLFGGGNLIVPADWRVETRIVPVFGGVGDSRPDGNPAEGAPTLRLEGVAIFGGWGVTAEPPGEELVTA